MRELSERSAGFTDSVIRRMTRVANKYGAVNLSQGFPDFDPPQEITDRLSEVAKTLNQNGIDTEIFQAGDPDKDNVKAAAAKLKEADALVVGSPVYWASPTGQIIEFMDKLCSMAGKDMLHKPAAAVASARRAGTTATLDVLQKYFSYHEMPVVSANYWNMVHGNTPAEVQQDEEGLQIMRTLGSNMAWLLKCIEAGKAAGITIPQAEDKIKTNFIR